MLLASLVPFLTQYCWPQGYRVRTSCVGITCSFVYILHFATFASQLSTSSYLTLRCASLSFTYSLTIVANLTHQHTLLCLGNIQLSTSSYLTLRSHVIVSRFSGSTNILEPFRALSLLVRQKPRTQSYIPIKYPFSSIFQKTAGEILYSAITAAS